MQAELFLAYVFVRQAGVGEGYGIAFIEFQREVSSFSIGVGQGNVSIEVMLQQDRKRNSSGDI
ncbi:MAG: hypothetical protein PVG66_08250 [Chromatiales bacterium]|jgi:hypothetical protein